MHRHFEPLRPNRILGRPDKYEFTHGTNSVCVYDIRTLDFVKEIPVGANDQVYVYGCSGNGALVRFTDIAKIGGWMISCLGGKFWSAAIDRRFR